MSSKSVDLSWDVMLVYLSQLEVRASELCPLIILQGWYS